MEPQRKRNDRLGRNRRQFQQVEHRRKILRRWTESDTHAHTFSDPNRDSYADGNCDDPAEAAIYAEAAPDSGTSTLEVRK